MEDKDFKKSIDDREKIIIKTSIIGIITNVFLAIFKASIGILSNSIAITLDAVNNLSDAMSSVITIIGAKLGSKKPDKKHPLGHGRIEYISSMLVAAIVLYAGITSMVESIKKIIKPELANYSTVSLIIIGVAIIVKLLLGSYVKIQGKKVNSSALVASGSDASFDAILSISVLASAVIFVVCDISLESYVGLIISIFIIKAGIDMMIENPEISTKIKEILKAEKEVRGAYDLNLFNYGPEKYYGSVHLELPDTMTVYEVDMLTRKVQLEIYTKTGVIMTGIGVYSYNTKEDESAKIQNTIQNIVLSHEWALQIHGFYFDKQKNSISFDVVINFDIEHSDALKILKEEIGKTYPYYELQIVTDIDVTD